MNDHAEAVAMNNFVHLGVNWDLASILTEKIFVVVEKQKIIEIC